MSKKFRTKNSKYRSVIFGVVAIVASLTMFASACADTTDNEDNTSSSTKVDEQVLKNGNFEFFSDNDGTYLLGTPDNWSSGTGSGATTSDSASGVLDTTAENWSRLTDPDLPQTLWNNAALDTDDEDYVNYNASPVDLPFRDPASAILENEDDDEDDETDDYYIADDAEYIDNPYTHNYRWDGDTLYDADGNEVEYYTDEDGNYFAESDDSPIETHVLMIHNYVEDDKQGTETYYTSSTTLTLEANTAAKISLWVKTSDLYFGGNNDTRTEVIDQRGAYIQLAQTVGGTTLDSFRIENINTAVLNPYDEETGTWQNGNNGWVQYTLYISACDYAETTITLTLGLGEASIYTLEGYAFFDDVTYEKYLSVDEMIEAAGGQETFDNLVNDPDKTTTCNLLSDADEKIFRVDKEVFNNGDTTVDHYSNKYNYHLDLAIESELEEGQRTDVTLTSSNLTAGLTVDEDGYVSSRGEATLFGDIASPETQTTYLPVGLNNNGINVEDDVIANLTVTSADSWTSAIGGNYQTIVDDALRTAVDLPGAGESASTLLILSARGAAYEAVISDDSFNIEADGYKIVTFWVKTSELDSITTLTVSARQVGNTGNSSSITVDSTTIDTTTINDIEDVYNGWVQCYALVSNTLDESQQFELVINYGVTEIRETTSSDYYGGWAAVTNISTLDVNETAFGYADSGTRAVSLTISESSSTDTSFDDTFYSNQIQTGMAVPSNYKGVNGASASVTSQPVEISAYDRVNNNEYAGLINRDYFDTYKETYAELLDRLDASSPLKALFATDANWDNVIGSTVNQPLLIVNTVRQITESLSGLYNYGYIGSDSSASSNSYVAVSVRVKVSSGAVATVYLVDTESKQPLSFSTPEYTFWYDNDGNVLKGEPEDGASREEQRANIAYTLTSNGLYEDEDGNYYANLYNYEREYYDERASYYDSEGNAVSFDRLVDGEIYYANARCSEYAPHYLVTSNGDRVYSYVSGLDDNVIYNYFVDGEVDTDIQVMTFDTTLATPRYTAEESSPYSFTIDAINNEELANKWITVSFLIHTGSEAKNYRLEVWSGTRDAETTDGVIEGSYVLFDYSAVSLDEDTYNSLLSYYTDNIINAYRIALREANPDIQFASNDEGIAYYEELAEENNITVDLYDYDAQYYTYTLYDSATYVPFNEDTAEDDESGYNYAYSDYTESLAVLKVDDSIVTGSPMMNMFIDYSTVDKDISITTTSDVEDDDDHDHTATDETNIWLLTSSIIMVIAILIAIIVLLIRDLRKKFKRRPKVGKNTYNYKKNKRYVRTYVKEHGETPIDGAGNANADEMTPSSVDGQQTTDENAQFEHQLEDQVESSPESNEVNDGEDNGNGGPTEGNN